MSSIRANLISVLMLIPMGGTIFCQRRVGPPSVYVSKGACPFECCRYGKWVATRRLVLLDHPGGHPVANFSEGEQVLAITGEVITHPVRFKRSGDYPYHDEVPAGSAVYLLHPLGEGYWLVWYRGKIISIEAYDAPNVPYQWWAKIKRHSGRIGWIRISTTDLPFDGADGCG